MGGKRQNRRVPRATYRIQLNREFNFRAATRIIPYLRALGVADSYTSPILQAGADSTHGYDVARFDRLNPNLGSTGDFEGFARSLEEAGLTLIVDIVPNHMGTAGDNVWWQDVLRNGPKSNYANWFDINWKPALPELEGKILRPILEAPLNRVLAAGKIRLAYERKRFWIAYYDKRFPLNERSEFALAECVTRSGLRKTLRRFNSTSHLGQLLDQQHYLPASWREAGSKINYRRFFDVSELVSIRMELPEVFEAAHKLLLEWVRSGKIRGLRVDHPDGLWNPNQYFERLAASVGARSSGRPYVVAEKILTGDERLPSDWPVDGTTGYDFLNIVNGLFVDGRNEAQFDKLYAECTGRTLDFEESARLGKKKVLTTSLLADVTALAGRFKGLWKTPSYSVARIREALTEIIACFPVYRTYITEETRVPSPADARHIRRALHLAVSRDSRLPPELFRMIGSVLLLNPRSIGIPGAQLGSTRKQEPTRSQRVDAVASREFVMKFQQLTGPAAAKGIEDTAFYNFNRLISLNEVGGDPGAFGRSIQEFHKHNSYLSRHWPHTLLATATHDTKRGEDARARINVLSELPADWNQAIQRWAAMNSSHKTVVDGKAAPDANDEILFYQTLVGAWEITSIRAYGGKPPQPPISELKDRLAAYMLKAVREAKVHTSWTDSNSNYEAAVANFIAQSLDPSENIRFLADFASFHSRIAFFGCFNSLSQLLLKLTSPGVPDTYQGTEFWDLNLVDPDNRRPVDYQSRASQLKHLERDLETIGKLKLARKLVSDLPDTRIKLFVLWQTLRFRSGHPGLFIKGNYIPLKASGPAAAHVVAFARKSENETTITVAPRLCVTLSRDGMNPPIGYAVWGDTVVRVPGKTRAFRNLFTGESIRMIIHSGKGAIRLAEALKEFPVALLVAG